MMPLSIDDLARVTEASTRLRRAADYLDRADDGLFRMTIGKEGREYALRGVCFALDDLQRVRDLLRATMVFNSEAMECDP